MLLNAPSYEAVKLTITATSVPSHTTESAKGSSDAITRCPSIHAARSLGHTSHRLLLGEDLEALTRSRAKPAPGDAAAALDLRKQFQPHSIKSPSSVSAQIIESEAHGIVFRSAD
ncbi:hypothetical protein NQZ68_005721 [Dissostichus eleginoides]|nr:hypothetical protein NQZ68_005721 [Dissostichus eleginoides]